MLTGLYPRHHGVRSHETALPESVPTLAEELAASGYHTMAIVNSKQLLARYGLHRGFQQFEYFPERVDKHRVRSASEQVDLALEWIAQVRENPFFLFLHNYDVHSDYDPSPRFARGFVRPYAGLIRGTTGDLMRVRRGEVVLAPGDLQHLVDLYDAGIREVDADVGRLFDYLSATELVATTIVVLTSDHGEEFLEHGGVLHGRTMYREVLDVPLIVRGPGVPEDRRVEGLVQPSDIRATILDLLRIPSADTTDGKSLFTIWAGGSRRSPERHVLAEADHNRDAGDDTLEMIQTDKYKLIFDRSTETSWLYDREKDPEERTDVSSQYPDVVNALLEELRSRDRDRRLGNPISPPTGSEREALRSLGYLQ
jgi:arylsulfatase A-like enzyme